MTRKTLHRSILALIVAGTFASCQKSSLPEEVTGAALNAAEKSLVAAAGFNSNWAEKTADGKYLIEGDILLTQTQLQEMDGKTPTNNFIIANEEHYRTFDSPIKYYTDRN